jgi:polysaccharide export outer membrane protein
MPTRKTVFLIGLVGLMTLLTGCFSSNAADLNAFLKPTQADVTMDDYILQPPDTVTVIASSIPELQGAGSQIGQSQVIRPDGKISFENIGEIQVAGKTPRQVAGIISQKLVELYKLTGDHPVDVRVRNESKHYYVIGMVRYPGAQIFTGRETTLAAISRAVPTNLAWEEKTQVIRPSLVPGEPSKIFSLNFKKMVEHGKMGQNVLLQEGDVIYVPPTILASIGLTIGEIARPILSGGAAAQMVTGGS